MEILIPNMNVLIKQLQSKSRKRQERFQNLTLPISFLLLTVQHLCLELLTLSVTISMSLQEILLKDGVAARFGLATFSDEVYGRIGGLAE